MVELENYYPHFKVLQVPNQRMSNFLAENGCIYDSDYLTFRPLNHSTRFGVRERQALHGTRGTCFPVLTKGFHVNRFHFNDASLFYRLVETFCGDMGVLWMKKGAEPSVVSIFLPRKGLPMAGFIENLYPGAEDGAHRKLEGLCDQLRRYMEGVDIDFSLALLDMDLCYDFQKRVLLKAKKIPRGKVIPYGKLAEGINAPGAARAVGTALAKNPFSLILPCHKVVRASGQIGNFGSGPEMKRTLLRLEGVEVSEEGKIDRRFFWIPASAGTTENGIFRLPSNLNLQMRCK